MANQEGHRKNMTKKKPAPKKGPAVPAKKTPVPAKKKTAKPSPTPKPPVVLPSKKKHAPKKSYWSVIVGIFWVTLALITGFLVGALILCLVSSWTPCYTSWCGKIAGGDNNNHQTIRVGDITGNSNIVNNINIDYSASKPCSKTVQTDRVVLKEMGSRIIPAGPMVDVASIARPDVIYLEPCSMHCGIKKVIPPYGNVAFMIPEGWTVNSNVKAPSCDYERIQDGRPIGSGHTFGSYLQFRNKTGAPLQVEFECYPARRR
jgi:hypothetical protein